jgi:Fe2+ transport system protein FeoA
MSLNRPELRTALDLNRDEMAMVAGFADDRLASMLLEMGCRPGHSICMVRKGYFRGPLYLKIEDRVMAFRQEEAGSIILTDPR